jgi:hypothetical protein
MERSKVVRGESVGMELRLRCNCGADKKFGVNSHYRCSDAATLSDKNL